MHAENSSVRGQNLFTHEENVFEGAENSSDASNAWPKLHLFCSAATYPENACVNLLHLASDQLHGSLARAGRRKGFIRKDKWA